MRILVTGSSGRLGRAVVGELLAHGHAVMPTDVRPPAGVDGPATRIADLTRVDQVRPLMAGVDVVCHLGNIPWFDPPQYAPGFANNVSANYNVFQAAEEAGIGRAVYASSVQSYGMLGSPCVPPRYLPVDEAHPLLATNPYAVSKAVGESIAESFVRRGVVRQVISLRYTAIVPEWPVEGTGPESATGSLFTRVSVAEAARATRLACEVERAGHTPVNVVSGRPAVAWREADLVAAYGAMPAVRGALRGKEALISGERAREVLGFEGE